METASQLRKELSEVFKQLRSGELKHKEAAELANLAGKMINSAKVQIDYYALRKESPRIAFLEENKP